MSITRIQRRLQGGFRPFALRTSDGREYPVRHPECILLARDSLAVLDRDGEIANLDALHVVAIKNLPLRKNGAHPRSRG